MLNFSAAWLFDGAFVLIMAVSIFLAAKLGAFKAVSGIAGTVAGLIAGLLFQEQISAPIAEFLNPILEKAIGSWDFSEFMQLSSETIATLSEDLSHVISAWEQSSGGQIPQVLISAITGIIVPKLADIFAFLVIFFVVKLAVIFVLHLFNDYIPLFRTLSHGLGMVLGAVSGLLIILVLCWAVLQYAPADEAAGMINQQSLRESIVGGMLCPFFD